MLLFLFFLVQNMVLYDAWQIEKEPIQNCTLLNFIYFSATINHAGLLGNHYKNDYTKSSKNFHSYFHLKEIDLEMKVM